MAGRRVAVEERTEAVQAGDDGVNPAFHRAILKIALELKKPNAPRPQPAGQPSDLPPAFEWADDT